MKLTKEAESLVRKQWRNPMEVLNIVLEELMKDLDDDVSKPEWRGTNVPVSPRKRCQFSGLAGFLLGRSAGPDDFLKHLTEKIYYLDTLNDGSVLSQVRI